LKYNLKNRPDAYIHHPKVIAWFEGFEAELKEMDFAQWYEDNILNIMARFDLHSASGIHPKECLQYFIERVILGE